MFSLSLCIENGHLGLLYTFTLHLDIMCTRAKMLWPKALPLDLDFGLCARAKLFKNNEEQDGQ